MSEPQKLAIVAGLDEPYSTLVLLVTRIPVRIEEAIGVKGTDLDGHVLTLRRVVYAGKTHPLLVPNFLNRARSSISMIGILRCSLG